MLVKQSKLSLNNIATANYFQALQTMEVWFESTDVMEDPKFGFPHQVLLLGVTRPDSGDLDRVRFLRRETPHEDPGIRQGVVRA